MKKLLLLLALTTASFADENWFSYRYGKLGAGTLEAPHTDPGVAAGGGIRVVTGHSGVDLSVDYIEHSGSDHLILGKGLFLFFLTPGWKHSLYGGLGLGYGRLKNEGHNFVGLFGEGVIGYALITHTRVLAFVEAGIHQPAIPTGSPTVIYRQPAATLTFGVGF
ncbi:MAG: hypothetical protein AB7F31_01765 [Parachlamydiales bacterium]